MEQARIEHAPNVSLLTYIAMVNDAMVNKPSLVGVAICIKTLWPIKGIGF